MPLRCRKATLPIDDFKVVFSARSASEVRTARWVAYDMENAVGVG